MRVNNASLAVALALIAACQVERDIDEHASEIGQPATACGRDRESLACLEEMQVERNREAMV